jgi:molybdopterin molybdotransferase
MSDSLISVDDARVRILDHARPPSETETVAADAALGRILAEPLVSTVSVPPMDNSAMDGYALRLADHAPDRWLKVGQRIPAGSLGRPIQPGEVARIFTGAPIPGNADTVVMQEDCEAREGEVRITRPPRLGDHIRRAGEDIQTGQTVLASGTRLGPGQLGVAASVGAARLAVYRRLRVAVFFTGDEIVMPGQPLPAGRIYNSNRATLLGLLADLGCDIVDLGQVADSLEATLAALEEASRVADMVVTSGGVSIGEEDHVKNAVERLGRIEMWKVAMKPGKPLVYGQVGTADFMGLPGNPVSAFVVFCLFVRPFLLKRMGAQAEQPLAFQVPAAFDWPKPGKRREFLRARLDQGQAALYPSQSSGVLTSVAWADGLVDIPIGSTVKPGDTVTFIPLSEMLK